MKNLLKQTEFYLAVVIVLLAIVITALNPDFLTLQNIFGLLKSFSVIGIMAVGVLFVMVLGGTPDVSFTAIAQVAQYVVVLMTIHWGGNLFLAFLVAAVLGTILGSANGFIIHYFKVPTIVVSIALYNLYFGLLYVFTGGNVIYEVPEMFHKFADVEFFTMTGQAGSTFGLTLFPLVWLAVLLLGWFILRHTTLGRSVYAIGGNEVAAERVGINIFKTRVFVFSFLGFLAGIASIVHVAIVQSAIPNIIVGQELNVIAAVVLGGVSVFGGKGRVVGTFLGVALFAILNNGLTLLRISSYWYQVSIGVVIVVSISINAVQELIQQRRRVRVNVE